MGKVEVEATGLHQEYTTCIQHRLWLLTLAVDLLVTCLFFATSVLPDLDPVLLFTIILVQPANVIENTLV